MDKPAHFQAAMTAALAGRDAARDEIFSWLQNLSPEERAKVPPEKFARLTPEQFAILLGHALPKVTFDTAVARSEPDQAMLPMPGETRAFSRSAEAIKIRSPFHHALRLAAMVGLCTGLTSVGTVWAAPYALNLVPPPIRPVNVASWPLCARLDPSTDGCVYHVESTLTWPDAAQLLGMPLPTLLAANRAIGNPPLIQGSPIIIWRFRHSLSN